MTSTKQATTDRILRRDVVAYHEPRVRAPRKDTRPAACFVDQEFHLVHGLWNVLYFRVATAIKWLWFAVASDTGTECDEAPFHN